MINGVLVERTVADVVPALKTNSEGLKKVLEQLVTEYRTKQDEMEKWKVRGQRTFGSCAGNPEADANTDSAEEEQHPGRPAVSLS